MVGSREDLGDGQTDICGKGRCGARASGTPGKMSQRLYVTFLYRSTYYSYLRDFYHLRHSALSSAPDVNKVDCSHVKQSTIRNYEQISSTVHVIVIV